LNAVNPARTWRYDEWAGLALLEAAPPNGNRDLEAAPPNGNRDKNVAPTVQSYCRSPAPLHPCSLSTIHCSLSHVLRPPGYPRSIRLQTQGPQVHAGGLLGFGGRSQQQAIILIINAPQQPQAKPQGIFGQ